MNISAFSFLAILFASSISAQQQQVTSNQNGTGSTTISEGPKSTTTSEGPNLSIAKVGRDDLIGISVYDAPELTRNVRVDGEGNIRLPMLRKRIQAAGLDPGNSRGQSQLHWWMSTF